MQQLKKIRPAHEQIMDLMVEHPGISLREMAVASGYTVSYLSIMTNSDAFRARLAEKMGEARAGRATADLPLRMRAVAAVALDKLSDHVERSEDPDFLRTTADMMLHRLGYAPKTGGIAASGDVNVQQNFFVPREVLAELRGRIIDGSASVASGEALVSPSVARREVLVEAKAGELLPPHE